MAVLSIYYIYRQRNDSFEYWNDENLEKDKFLHYKDLIRSKK